MSERMPADLQAALDESVDRRGAFGQPAIFSSETTSTNDIAATLAERGAAEGTMAIALAQTAGRGRLGRQWFSPPAAGLYVSVVCRSPRAAPFLTLAGGVAVADGIRAATGLPVTIKWPNDVVVADAVAPARFRKLAGILAEASTGPDGTVQHVVLGFGINVLRVTYPAAISTRATSIELELGRPVERGAVLAEILCALNGHITALRRGEYERMLARWRELSPTSIGSRVEWTADGMTRMGMTAGIDDGGRLLVAAQNRVERIVAGEVRWM
jgi:BirA family transcriptional regulator, biotin operon repressor / biotin---[acetyl-CoA-carboxylase] ligase